VRYIVANIRGKARRVTSNGRSYLVADMTLIVPGVLNGSQGALYYPPDEIAKNYKAWANAPLTLGHPTANGRHVSARAPGVRDRLGLGEVRTPAVRRKDGALVAEGWFDEARVKKVAPSVHNALLRGEKIELSTGLFTDNAPVENGVCPRTGRQYTHLARNYRPDHVAILPDQTGACSLNDGCGVFNQQKPLVTNRETTMDKAEAIEYLTANCACWQGEDGEETLNEMADERVVAMAERELAANEAAGEEVVEEPAPRKKATANMGKGACKPLKKGKKSVAAMADDEDEYTGNRSEEDDELLANAREIVREKQAELIAGLVRNTKDPKARKAAVEVLGRIKVTDLKVLAAGINPAPAKAAGGKSSVSDRVENRLRNYAGAGAADMSGLFDDPFGAGDDELTDNAEEALVLPTLEYEEPFDRAGKDRAANNGKAK